MGCVYAIAKFVFCFIVVFIGIGLSATIYGLPIGVPLMLGGMLLLLAK